MAYQALGLGTVANDGTGDDLRTGGDKINDNFVELYTKLGDGSTLYGLTFPNATDTVVALAETQTLTNKTIDSATNTLTLDLSEGTLTGTTAEFNTALSDGSFATLAGTETLTNKTLTSPTINTGTITGTFDGAVGGSTPAAGSFTTVTLSDYFQLAVFADGTARDAAIASPSAGMMCFVSDNGSGAPKAQAYDGTSWIDLH